MIEEVTETIRVLQVNIHFKYLMKEKYLEQLPFSQLFDKYIKILKQLTTYDEDEWDSDNLTVMRKTQNVMDSKMQQAHDWLQDPQALHGGVGEKSVRQVSE